MMRRPNFLLRLVLGGWILSSSLAVGYLLVPAPKTESLTVLCTVTAPDCQR